MKTLLFFACATALFLASVTTVPAQYAIDWHKVAGGGGTSTGGIYAVSGTIGQHDVGMSGDGNFSVLGGFWSLYAMQTAGAPTLNIARTPTNTVVVFWRIPVADWRLDTATTLVGGSLLWTEVSPPYETNGLNLQFREPTPIGNKFYRLHRP